MSRKPTSNVPADGERNARFGYVLQDRASARLIYEALNARKLTWVGLANRDAGVADDLVLGLGSKVIGHQFKHTRQAKPVGVTRLLLGTEGYIRKLSSAYSQLRAQFPNSDVVIRYFTMDVPTINDRLVEEWDESSTKLFLGEWAENQGRSLVEWRGTRWQPLIDELQSMSVLDEAEFESFWGSFDLVMGASAASALDPFEDSLRSDQIEQIAIAISSLVVDGFEKETWTRSELLSSLGWSDPTKARFSHVFPVGSYVQKNDVSETELAIALRSHTSGYISLVGSPGSGKSTLLQQVLRDSPDVRMVRYLAFVPGNVQGQGRGEADNFYDDLIASLSETGLKPVRLINPTTQARQEMFEMLLKQAGELYSKSRIRCLIIVDGLDHIPREEQPAHSLLKTLPLPNSIPDGVLFVLGTQRLDFKDIPLAVADEALQSNRCVRVAPLSEEAVFGMAEKLGLPKEIDASSVYSVSGGHPLVTRYLIGRLKVADAEEREQLITGEFGFDGDLEDVYRAAWRSFERLPDGDLVQRVLALIGYAEGLIEPSSLASVTSTAAVETTLREASHLLDVSDFGWSVFHNSFRLFIQQQPILRFGDPDPAFAESAVYECLANLAADASSSNSQRYLEFHYRYKSGAIETALALASRSYFINQYCRDRSAHEIRGDIVDAFRSLKMKPDPVKLFELMLVHDEVGRRAFVIEQAISLPEAYIAVGNLQGAADVLSDGYEEGRQWVVVDALLQAGRQNQARQLFELHNPFKLSDWHVGSQLKEATHNAYPWAQRAILFMDEEQLEHFISKTFAQFPAPESDFDAEPEDLARSVGAQIARALAAAEPNRDIESLVQRWKVSAEAIPILYLEAAETSDLEGDAKLVRRRLQQTIGFHAAKQLHPSWQMLGAKLAVRNEAPDIARTFLENAPLVGLDSLDSVSQREETAPLCRRLLEGIVLRKIIGLEIAIPSTPDERLRKGVQHHIITLANAIGDIRSGKVDGSASVGRLTSQAMRFLATAHWMEGEDYFSSYFMPGVALVIVDAAFRLVEITETGRAELIEFIDELMMKEQTAFRWWHKFRRRVALRVFSADQNLSAAQRRLNDGFTDLDTANLMESAEEATAYARAFAHIGDSTRAIEILDSLRIGALGITAAAKKDGHYSLWCDLLVQANTADPEARAQRAFAVLKLIDGLRNGEGSNMGPRIVRQTLYEAALDNPGTAWRVAQWSSETGAVGWDGILDALLKSILARGTLPPAVVLTAWSSLCLPWYEEPHASSVTQGQFLADLFSVAAEDEIAELETSAVNYVSERARPMIRLSLLSVIEQATATCGSGELVKDAKARWGESVLKGDGSDPYSDSYLRLVTLGEVREALAEERDNATKHKDRGYVGATESYELQLATARIIRTGNWLEAERFAEEEPDVVRNFEITKALVRLACENSNTEAAQRIAEPFLNPENEGWDWASGYDRMQRHELLHLLGTPDSHRTAHDEFIDDIAKGKYGVGSTIWETDTIFPLLFEKIPWTEIWKTMEKQIRDMRDYQLGRPVKECEKLESDEELLVSIFVWALGLAATAVRVEAICGLHVLRKAGQTDLFNSVVEALLEKGDECALLAVGLITDAPDDVKLKDRFSGRLQEWLEHPDAGIAGSAAFLASKWDVAIAFKSVPLPKFYELELPTAEVPRGEGIVDSRTKALVVQDVFAWTENWIHIVKNISRFSGVSIQHIRRRVDQLVQAWGGVEKFGQPALKRLEISLANIELKLSYRKPQAEAVLRALRYVLGELWRGERLSTQELMFGLFEAHAAPDRAKVLSIAQRPKGLSLSRIPRNLWGDEKEAWLDKVSEDILSSQVGVPSKALADWSREVIVDFRSSAIKERIACNTMQSDSVENFDDFRDSLSGVLYLSKFAASYKDKDIHPGRVAVFRPHYLAGIDDDVLIFCPRTAKLLNWVTDPRVPGLYFDDKGTEMVRTIWWRDGLPQSVGESARHAEGQRVMLSELGQQQFEVEFGKIKLFHSAYREVQNSDDRERSDRQFAFSSPKLLSSDH